MTQRFLSIRQVSQTVTLSRATIYRRVREGTFPRPHPLGGRRVAWTERDIEAWGARVTADPGG